MTRLLDAYADVLPYGLQPTPFGEVWRALQLVASTVWDVDPAVYRAGIAWGWYVQRNPDALAAQRELVIAALISEQAPLIKADQTTAELVEYLRQWREYRPTYDRLEAIYKLFSADVEILPISTPGAPPVSDTRLAFYVRIYGVDFSRLLTLEEAYTIAIRATPLGSRPIVYYEFDEQLSVDTQPLKAGIASINYENDAICEPVELNNYTFIVADATTGQIVSGFSNELVYGEIEGIILQSPRLVYGVDITVPAAQFWFTENGRNETENTVLQPNSTVTVYDENGDTITDEDTIGMYDTASVLAYMQANGDMISKQDDVLIDDDGELGLQVDSGPISAWSVFAERVFTLSFANTQLPDVTITLPADETGYKGTSITLPTMSGEYESGGKTWKPSAWDIGAFGDSYTLNADTVAHLIFEEVQQYQEIQLYLASGQKNAQGGITSSFKGNVDSTYVYPLYTDSSLTTRFVYDYSNDYEVGYYVSGVWTPRLQHVSDMPASSSDFKLGYIVLDVGSLWFVCSGSSVGISFNSITIRIRKKGQQVFALYFNASSVYNNVSMAYNTAYDMNGSPNTGSSPIPLTSNFPGKDIVGVYGSAGNLVSSGYKNFSWVGSTKLRVGYYNTDAGTLSARLLLFTTDQYIDIAYINTSGNTSVSSGSAKILYDKDGHYLLYIPSLFTYTPLALFKHNGSCADNSSGNYIKSTTLGNYTGPSDALCLKQTYGTISFSYIWYLRTPISQ